MKNWINTYFSSSYLLSNTSGSKFESFYLYFPIVLAALVTGYRIYFLLKGKRPLAYKPLDSYLFWGGISFSLIGLFLYFSRNQGLPIFSTRLVSYVWFLLLLCYAAFLLYYQIKIMPGKLKKYYESQRKAKYLKK